MRPVLTRSWPGADPAIREAHLELTRKEGCTYHGFRGILGRQLTASRDDAQALYYLLGDNKNSCGSHCFHNVFQWFPLYYLLTRWRGALYYILGDNKQSGGNHWFYNVFQWFRLYYLLRLDISEIYIISSRKPLVLQRFLRFPNEFPLYYLLGDNKQSCKDHWFYNVLKGFDYFIS